MESRGGGPRLYVHACPQECNVIHSWSCKTNSRNGISQLTGVNYHTRERGRPRRKECVCVGGGGGILNRDKHNSYCGYDVNVYMQN